MNDYIKIVLQADPSGMISGFQQAEGAVAKLISVTQSAGKTAVAGFQMWERFGQTVKTAGIKTMAGGISIATGLGAAAKAASTYQTQMTNVQSLTKATNYAMAQDTERLMKMSTRLPQSATQLASGLYDIASSGFAGADGMKVLEASATAASAGLTDTKVASQAIVAVMNAYGLSADKAADISDTLFQGVNVGVMTFEQLAGSMGQWVGMAAQVGVAADEGTAAIAAMTLAGIGTDEAATYLSRLMEAFIQPSEKMTATAKDMGFVSAKAMLDAKGLGGALLALNDKTGGNAEKFNDLFGSIQAARGAMAIVANDGKNWARTAGAITNETARAGAAQEVYAYQSQTLAAKWQMLKNAGQNLLIGIGTPLLKPLGIIMGWLTSIITAVTNFTSGMSGAIAGMGTFGSIILTVAGAFATFFPQLVAARIALTGFRAIIAMFSGGGAAVGFAGFLANMGARFPMITASVVALGKAIKGLTGFTMIQNAFTAIKGMMIGTSPLVMMAGGGKALAMKGAQMGWAALTSTIGLTSIGLAAVSFAAIKTYEAFTKARDAGKQMGEELKASLDLGSMSGIRKATDTISSEIDKAKSKIAELGADPEDTGRFGYNLPAGTAAQLTFLDWLPFSNFGDTGKQIIEQREYIKSLEEQEELAKKRNEKFETLATLLGAGAIGANRMRSEMYVGNSFLGEMDISAPGKGQVDYKITDLLGKEWADPMIQSQMKNVATVLGGSVESMIYDVERAMKANDINLSDIFNDDGSLADGAEEAFGKVSNYLARMNDLTPAGQRTATAFMAVDDAALDAASSVEKLGEAIKAALDEAYGYEAAKDSFEGMVNSALSAVEEIRDRGNLDEAMNFGNFSEDAITLRGQWRDMIGGMVEETTEWAKSQKDVTGVQIAQHVQGQIDLLKTYGQEMGLSTEFVDHYVAALQEAVANGSIITSFTTNVDEAMGQLKGYLTMVGRTPEQIETIIQVLNSERSQQEIYDFLVAQGMVPEQALTTIKVAKEAAIADLTQYLNMLGEVDQKKLIQAVIDVSVDGITDQEKSDLATNFDLEDDQINKIVELSGNGFIQAETLKGTLEQINQENPTPEVNVTGNAESKLNAIQSLLNTIAGRPDINKNVTITTTNKNVDGFVPPGPAQPPRRSTGNPNRDGKKAGSAWGSILHYARGGVADIRDWTGYGPENHTAQIAPAGAMRVWAEPETGGEAYIPLAGGAKRSRAEAIWKAVGRRFGKDVSMYASGGLLDGRLNSKGSTAEDWYRGVQKAADDQKKAAEDQKRAAEDQKRAAEDARRNERDVMSYRVDIEGSMTQVEQFGGLLHQMQGLPAYSAEWMEIGRSAVGVAKSMKEAAYAANDFFYNTKNMSDTQYLDHLRDRLRDTRMYTEEYWAAAKAVWDQEQKMREEQWAVQDQTYSNGKKNDASRIKDLQNRLAFEKAWSSEWLAIGFEIQEAEDKKIKRELQYGVKSNAQYVAHLKARLAATEKFSDDWDSITQELMEIQTAGLTKVADIYEKFGNRMYASSTSLEKWLARQVKIGEKFGATMQALKDSGQIDQSMLNKLVEMGPESSGLANALLDAVKKGTMPEIKTLLDRAEQLGTGVTAYGKNTYAQAPIPTPALPASKISPSAAAVWKATIEEQKIVVTLPGAVISDPNDAQRLGNVLAFSLNTAGA